MGAGASAGVQAGIQAATQDDLMQLLSGLARQAHDKISRAVGKVCKDDPPDQPSDVEVEVILAASGAKLGSWRLPGTAVADDIKEHIIAQSTESDYHLVKLLYGERVLSGNDSLASLRLASAPVALRCIIQRASQTISCTAKLYEVSAMEIECDNPFAVDAEFKVILEGMAVCNREDTQVASQRSENAYPFHVTKTVLKVKAQSAAKFGVRFLPFDAPAYFRGYLRFVDAKVGEFFYELLGKSMLPDFLEYYRLRSISEETVAKEIIIPRRNMQKERARMCVEQFGGVLAPRTDALCYDVELSSPCYTAPRPVAMSGSGLGKLRLEFSSNEPGVFPCTVKLTSDEDIRLFHVECQVTDTQP